MLYHSEFFALIYRFEKIILTEELWASDTR